MSLNRERLAHHVDLEHSWLNTGIDITADSAIPPLRWMLRPSRKTNKKWELKEKLSKLREELRKNKLPIKPQLVKERKMLRKELPLPKRNDIFYWLVYFSILNKVTIKWNSNKSKLWIRSSRSISPKFRIDWTKKFLYSLSHLWKIIPSCQYHNGKGKQNDNKHDKHHKNSCLTGCIFNNLLFRLSGLLLLLHIVLQQFLIFFIQSLV